MKKLSKSSSTVAVKTPKKSGLEIYNSICAGFNLPKNKQIQASLQNNDIYASIESLQQQDIRSLHLFFQKFRKIQNIKLCSKEYPIQSSSSKQPASRKSNDKEFTQSLLNEVGFLCKQSKSLTSLMLAGLAVSTEGWVLLSKGFNDFSCLKCLSVIDCKLNDKGLIALSHSLLKLNHLQTLDLSRNLITNGYLIARLISKSSVKRDEERWASELRNHSSTIQTGLQEVVIAHNSLGDDGIADILSSLSHDQWLRSIDVSFNKISSFNEIYSLLEVNNSILIFDIRGQAVPKNDFKKIVRKLKQNFSLCPDPHLAYKYGPKLQLLESEAGLNKKKKNAKKQVIVNIPVGESCGQCKQLSETLMFSENYCKTIFNRIASLKTQAQTKPTNEIISQIDKLSSEMKRLLDYIESSRTPE